MAYGILTAEDSLEENYRTDDLFDFSLDLSLLEERLQRTAKARITGLLGDFGSGKSTLLYQLEMKNSKGKAPRVIQFDVWKYPQREKLWENFLHDITYSIGGKSKEKKQRKETSGIKTQKTVSVGGSVGVPGLGATTGVSLTENYLPHNLREIQEDLARKLKRKRNGLIIVIEDLDRSADNGHYFVETLKYFVQNYDTGKTQFLIPIRNKEYNDYKDVYLKSLHSTIPFTGIPKTYVPFLESIISDDIQYTKADVQRLSDFLISFQYTYKNKGTIREVKFILREANETYISQRNQEVPTDWRVTIPLEFMYHGSPNSREGTGSYQHAKANRRVAKDSIWGSYLYALGTDADTLFRQDGSRAPALTDISILAFAGNPPSYLPFESSQFFGGPEFNNENPWKITSRYFTK